MSLLPIINRLCLPPTYRRQPVKYKSLHSIITSWYHIKLSCSHVLCANSEMILLLVWVHPGTSHSRASKSSPELASQFLPQTFHHAPGPVYVKSSLSSALTRRYKFCIKYHSRKSASLLAYNTMAGEKRYLQYSVG